MEHQSQSQDSGGEQMEIEEYIIEYGYTNTDMFNESQIANAASFLSATDTGRMQFPRTT